MKFIVKRADLNNALSMIGKAISNRPSHPILAATLINAVGNTISLTGFDLSLGIETRIVGDVETGGTIAIPYKVFADIVGKLPNNEDITLEVDESKIEKVASLSTSFGSYKIQCFEASEFPSLPTAGKDSLELPASDLLTGIKATLFAVSEEETKQVLTGVQIKSNADGLEFGATDGHRLAVLNTPNGSQKFTATIPARALQTLSGVLGKSDSVTIHYESGLVVFEFESTIITSRTLDGQFPNYQQLIPLEFERKVIVDRQELHDSISRLSVFTDKNTVCIELMQECIKVFWNDSSEIIPVEVIGEPLKLAFNPKYLQEGLSVMHSDEVEINLNTATSPVIIKPLKDVEMQYLVMPVQLRE